MVIQSDGITTMREANQNFSAVAGMADKKNAVVIMRHNKPAYALIKFDVLNVALSETDSIQHLSPEKAKALGDQIITEYEDVFKELAK